MAVFDSVTMKRLEDCWYSNDLDHALARLTAAQQAQIESWININLFDAAANSPPSRQMFNVTWQLPKGGDWRGIPLQDLFEIAAQGDELNAALLYGSLVCRIGVNRANETWWTFQQEIGFDRHTSRSYVLR